MMVFAAMIFLSAFLLFQVQPIMGKFFLPWFGGMPSVWTACMLFFQVALLLGYTYGHSLAGWIAWRRHRWIHPLFLSISFLLLLSCWWKWGAPLLPDSSWKPKDVDHPVSGILLLLGISVGLPCLMLASTSPLIQHWYGRVFPPKSPYRLYALSNLGSMLALLSYPVLVEPFLPLYRQTEIWLAGYFAFVVGSVYCSLKSDVGSGLAAEQDGFPHAGSVFGDKSSSPLRPPVRVLVAWGGLAACASVLLLAVTNEVCQEVAVFPFLWILPLSLYLITFILCFDSERWYCRSLFMGAYVLIACLSVMALHAGIEMSVPLQVLVYSLLLFCGAMICHGELVRMKPAPQFLTLFYLLVSLGGAAGGAFTALVAPRIFAGFWEFHLALWLVAALAVLILWRDRSSWVHLRSPWPALLVLFFLGVTAQAVFQANFDQAPFATWWDRFHSWINLLFGLFLFVLWGFHLLRKMKGGRNPLWLSLRCLLVSLAILGGVLMAQIKNSLLDAKTVVRNFYGVLTVLEEEKQDPEERILRLRHGRITHGLQYQHPDKASLLNTYYGPHSGIGLAFQYQRKRTLLNQEDYRLRIGVVGLGVGTLAAYTYAGDDLFIYEINPAVIQLSSPPRPIFTYLADSRSQKTVIPGDARVSLEQEMDRRDSRQFDLLAIDAFSSDSIPVHLLTKEAMAVYLYHLKPSGILAFHVSNRFLDLKPVVQGLASHYQLECARVEMKREGVFWRSVWLLVSRDREMLKDALIAKAIRSNENPPAQPLLWTDSFSNLFRCLHSRH
jgi:hypothetical protein